MLAAVEGTSSYGAGITDALMDEGLEVAEIRPPARSTHAHSGKSDQLDAEAAARSTIGREYQTLARPRQSGQRAALPILLASRSIIDQQRTANRNALTALTRGIDLGIDARKPLSDAQVRAVAAWRIGRCEESATAVTIARREARRLAVAVLEHTQLLKDNHRELQRLAEQLAPGLQDLPGLGPVTADHRLRLLPPRARPLRSRLRSARRGRAAAGVLRQHQPTPPVSIR